MDCTNARPVLLSLAAVAVLALAVPSRAQEGGQEPADESPAGETPGGVVPTPAPALDDEELARADREDQLTYDPRGRRDPFRALTGLVDVTEERKKYEGTLRGLLWTEVKLTAIFKTPKGNIATFEGGVKKTGYFAHQGDRFWNAIVHSIDYDNSTVTIREELDDPRLLKPYRDHPITLEAMPSTRGLAGAMGAREVSSGSSNPLGNAKVVNSKRIPGGY